MAEKMSVFDVLVDKGIVTWESLQEAGNKAQEEGVKIGNYLVTHHLVTPTQMTEAIATSAGYPFVDLSITDINRRALPLVPESRASSYTIIPYDIVDDTVYVAAPLTSVEDIDLRDNLYNLLSPHRVQMVVALTEEIEKAIKKNYRNEEEMRRLAKDSSLDLGEMSGEEDDLSDFTEAREISPSVKLVDLIIEQAITDKASDIHIEPDEDVLRVRYRLDGVLRDQQEFPLGLAERVSARIKVLCSLAIDETRKPQDGRLSVIGKNGEEMDLRVSILPLANHYEKIVMRILDNSNASLPLAALGFSEFNLKRIESSYKKPNGLVLVTGPTGSGKSTSLYSILNTISTPDINIITVEDPVEYTVPRINQVQVNPNPKVGMTFANTLRSALRQDPDVILVGEMRDHETASTAMDASLTGHLVLSTLHTNDAASAVTRLSEMGIEPFLVSSVVEAVVAQRLLRKLCSECKEAYTPDEDELESTGFEWGPEGPQELYRPVGCRECLNTGFLGRMGVHEVLVKDDDIIHAILEGKSSTEINKIAIQNGMIPIKHDGWERVRQGTTSIQEVLRVAS